MNGSREERKRKEMLSGWGERLKERLAYLEAILGVTVCDGEVDEDSEMGGK